MQGNTAYFFQSLFMAFGFLGMFFLGGLVYMKVKTVKTVIEIDDHFINIWLFMCSLVVLVFMLIAYGFGGGVDF